MRGPRSFAAEEIALVRQLWREYWDSFGLPMDFQGFGEEMEGLPGVYGAEGGALLLASIIMSLPGPSPCGVWTECRVR